MKITGVVGLNRVNAYGAVSGLKNKKKVESQTNDINSLRPQNFSRAITFGNNPAKNFSQVVSIAPEYKGILKGVYEEGGLGNVASEASVAFQDKENLDIRTFLPYYSPENSKGGIKVIYPIKDKIDAKNPESYDFKQVPVDYSLKNGENFVIHNDKKEFKILEDTGIKGNVESINETLDGVDKTPYKMFKIQDTGVNKQGKPPVYIVHTPELAQYPKAYNSGLNGAYGGGKFDDQVYSLFSKATIDAVEKMDKDEFSNFRPANFWLHDRQAFPSLIEISEKSAAGDEYWRGIKVHSSYHNPGRSYQGHYKSPIDFMRIAGSSADLESLKANSEDYEFVLDTIKKIEKVRNTSKKFAVEDILSKEEFEKLNHIFKPVFGNFVDSTGEYNLCEIPIAGVKTNPFNYTLGTVSRNFGKEMKNASTPEIAEGLTKDLASIPTVDIVNGSSAPSLNLDKKGAFAPGKDFPNSVKNGYTPLSEEIFKSPDALFEAKQANKKWLINALADSTSKGKEGLEELFTDADIKKGAKILGEFSPYREGDVLFTSWGRPDKQKGFPTTIESYIQFLKNDKISADYKQRAKFLISAGPWSPTNKDWATIQKQMNEIELLDNGIYKGNICFLNGRFSGKIVACSDYTMFTSRFEPCGITPLESYAGATPVISINTGGAPDFIKPYVKGAEITEETGFLTKHAYLVKPEVIGKNPDMAASALDAARIDALGKEGSELIQDAVELFDKKPFDYKKMMTNAANSKIGWDENVAFNLGKSALKRYKEEAWNIGSNNLEIKGMERNTEPLENLKGVFATSVYKAAVPEIIEVQKTAASSKNIVMAVCAAAVGVAAGALLVHFKGKKAKETDKKPEVSTLGTINMKDYQAK